VDRVQHVAAHSAAWNVQTDSSACACVCVMKVVGKMELAGVRYKNDGATFQVGRHSRD
jgi:hypothetical protein